MPGTRIDHDQPACGQRRRVPFHPAPIPLIIECDAAGKVALAVSLADVPPENRVDLFCCQEQASIDRLQEAIEQGPPPGALDPAEDWLFTFEQETQEREQQNQDNDKGQGY